MYHIAVLTIYNKEESRISCHSDHLYDECIS